MSFQFRIHSLVQLLVITASVAFHRSATAEPFSIVHAFADGSGAAAPFSSVILHDGWLFGTANMTSSEATNTLWAGTSTAGGALYAVRPDGSGFHLLQTFSPTRTTDGYGPFQGLTVVGNRLVGANLLGGTNGKGTLYSIGTDGSGFTILHQFGGTGDGGTPYAAPVLVGSTLYGMNFRGGAAGGGTIYSYDSVTGDYQVKHSFSFPGQSPLGSLTPIGDWLYGMVSDHRSATAFGQMFRYRPSDNAYETLHVFAGGHDGGYPYDTLTWDGGHYVYGTTLGFYSYVPSLQPEDVAGRLDEGVIFRYDIATHDYVVLHDFSLATGDGAKPNSSMLIAPDGFLYGIAHGSESFGGTEWGTLYRLSPDGSGFTLLHTFDSMDAGIVPMRALVWDDGTIYGTSVFGGTGTGVGNGTVWSYSVAVPEPSGLVGLGVGIALVATARCRRRWLIPALASHGKFRCPATPLRSPASSPRTWCHSTTAVASRKRNWPAPSPG